jgi:hypothetical protein
LIGAGRKDAERARGQRETYWALFKAHLDDALVERIREAINGNYALGDPAGFRLRSSKHWEGVSPRAKPADRRLSPNTVPYYSPVPPV